MRAYTIMDASKLFIAEPVGDTACPAGLKIAQHLAVIGVDRAIAIEVLDTYCPGNCTGDFC